MPSGRVIEDGLSFLLLVAGLAFFGSTAGTDRDASELTEGRARSRSAARPKVCASDATRRTVR
jgi:hypothetical protein